MKNVIFKLSVVNSAIATSANVKKSRYNADQDFTTEQTSIVARITGIANKADLTDEQIALFSSEDFTGEKWVTIFTLDRDGVIHDVPKDGTEIFARFTPYLNRETNEVMESYTLTGAPINAKRASSDVLAQAMAMLAVEEETE